MIAWITERIIRFRIVFEFARFVYFGLRSVAIPVMFLAISHRSREFELIDGLRYYYYQKKAIRNGSLAQHAQDAFVIEQFDGKQRGTFVDIGCNDPVRFNNTVILEREFDWHGVSIDAQEQFADRYLKERSTPFVHACVGDVHKTVSFARVSGRHYAGLSGVEDHLNKRKVANRTRDVSSIEQQPLMSIVASQNIGDIDCLFMDVEGYEMQVLKGIDFDALNIACIVLENDVGLWGDNKIRDFLSQRGYELRARVYGDDVYRRRSRLDPKHGGRVLRETESR